MDVEYDHHTWAAHLPTTQWTQTSVPPKPSAFDSLDVVRIELVRESRPLIRPRPEAILKLLIGTLKDPSSPLTRPL